jgi:hypothetical protein
MGIWPRRRTKRAVSIATGSCIVPILVASLVVVRNGTDALAFVAHKRIAGDDALRNRCVFWDAESTRAWWSCWSR